MLVDGVHRSINSDFARGPSRPPVPLLGRGNRPAVRCIHIRVVGHDPASRSGLHRGRRSCLHRLVETASSSEPPTSVGLACRPVGAWRRPSREATSFYERRPGHGRIFIGGGHSRPLAGEQVSRSPGDVFGSVTDGCTRQAPWPPQSTWKAHRRGWRARTNRTRSTGRGGHTTWNCRNKRKCLHTNAFGLYRMRNRDGRVEHLWGWRAGAFSRIHRHIGLLEQCVGGDVGVIGRRNGGVRRWAVSTAPGHQ